MPPSDHNEVEFNSLSLGYPMAAVLTSQRFGAPTWRFGGALALLLAAACGQKAAEPKAAAADSAAPMSSDSAGMANMPDMAHTPGMAMTGDPDRDFLRMMGDHHKGLIAMAHETMEAARGTPGSRTDGRKLDARQDGELEQMVKMLEAHWKDSYEPKVSPLDQATIDTLTQQSGPAYGARFYRNVAAHHRRAIEMIDEYLPKAVRADVKTLAEKMRKNQQAEILEFERKAAP